MTKDFRFALLGRNVAYSKSVDIFEAIFKLQKVSGQFDVCDVAPDDLEKRTRELALDGIRGLSVTIPYKSAIIPFLDDIDPVAQALEAVNSVCIDGASLWGYNTDCYGFSIPLQQHSDRMKHGRALVLGCGGAARAVLYSLYVDLEVRNFTIAGRSQPKLREFANKLGRRFERASLDTISLSAASATASKGYDLIVNCTPLGGWNHDDQSPLTSSFDFSGCKIYYDLNYNRNNRILQLARDSGVVVIDGSAMLVGQAIRSFDIWTGQRVPFEPIYDSVFG